MSLPARPATPVTHGLVIAKFDGRLSNAEVVGDQCGEWGDVSHFQVKKTVGKLKLLLTQMGFAVREEGAGGKARGNCKTRRG